jgi:hypothetical protein
MTGQEKCDLVQNVTTFTPNLDSDTNGERTVAKLSTVTVSSTSDICDTTIATQLFQAMVRKGKVY